MNPLNIIVVNDHLHVAGGSDQIALSSAIALADRGYQVTIFSAVGPAIPELLHRENLSLICSEQLPILKDSDRLRASVQGIWNAKPAKMLADLLQTLSPHETVIHVHSWTKALSSSVVSVALKKKFRVVFTLHDYFIACPTGSFFNHPKQTICNLSPMGVACLKENCDSRSYSHKAWRLGRQFVQAEFGLIPKDVKNFIAISNYSRSVIEPYLPKDAVIHLVDNPIAIAQGAPVSVRKNNHFVFVGRLAKEKGPNLFAEAAQELGCKALFVGDGECRQQISQINPTAEITGWVSQSEVAGYLKQARALIFPSLWHETQGLVVAEAAAMGVPAIVPNTCAARDFVVDGITGFWFKGGDSEDLRQKIAQLNDPELAHKMGLAAHERYWSNPATIERHVEQLEKVYANILIS
ncbi:glycosyltransferase family 4 protein [Leptolyngbya sp. FACHB-261]|uniref:glycosyltransferase family 4 protein n=1 Tax=Leptolyngbya sp. FACHB-261 TaxID=2692806 RepID=UPI001688968E|nr:glycosyltransferase family 4 protein [Leptolyngbya sp. FACHB-261]MBD2101747.1 glycosyltransferase family 4 protein [Leptolyngbya sp. FACHB-261]